MKRNFNSNDQRFLQYHNDENQPLTSDPWTPNRPLHMKLEIQVLGRDRHKKMWRGSAE